uniref:Uncharacterized protein n=1 Tax=Amphimedon queenslandica TaxID=400682 RepID=A0A1X7UDS4_AMPQE
MAQKEEQAPTYKDLIDFLQECEELSVATGELPSHGLNEELLLQVFAQVQNKEPILWHIRGLPDKGFYQDLHLYLKRSPYTRDNNKLLTSNYPRDAIIRFSRQVDTEPAEDLQTQATDCTEIIQKMAAELAFLEKELNGTQEAFVDAEQEIKKLSKYVNEQKAAPLAAGAESAFSHELRAEQSNLADKVVHLLKPFEETTREASGDYSSASVTIPIVNSLKRVMIVSENSTAPDNHAVKKTSHCHLSAMCRGDSRSTYPQPPAPSTASSGVSVIVQIPPFRPAHPEYGLPRWTRSLLQKFASDVKELNIKLLSTTPYDALRSQLIKRTTASEQRHLQQLFNKEELGDHTPS